MYINAIYELYYVQSSTMLTRALWEPFLNRLEDIATTV